MNNNGNIYIIDFPNGVLIMVKVLIVDDDEMQRVLLRSMVTRLGHDVNEAESGIVGQQKAIHWQPDVVLLDMMMPIHDGCSTCRNLRRKGYRGHIIMSQRGRYGCVWCG
jgi:two-component system, cell cycle response regulator DivK